MAHSGKAAPKRGFLGASGLPVLFVVLIAGASAWFWILYVPRQRAAAVDSWSRELSLRADIRKEALQRYFTDRLADAATLASYPTALSLVVAASAGASSGPALGHLEELLDRFTLYHEVLGVVLWDTAERPVAKSHDLAIESACAGPVREVLSSGRPEAGFHLHADLGPILTFAAPVRSPDGVTRGAVVIAVDPRGWLYPLLAQPLVGTSTGEALLVGRDGAEAVFLSPLRHLPDAALHYRHPLDAPGFAARAALEGVEAVGPYVDYRGVRVLSGGRRLLPTPWALVVKIDEDEALADFRGRMWRTALTDAALVVAVLGLAWGVWQRRERLQLAALARSAERIRQLNRLLRTISEINQLIVHTDDREALLSKACRILVEHGGFGIASVGLVDRGAGCVVPAARAGAGAESLDEITVRFNEMPNGWGSIGTAIRTGQHAVVPDLAAEPTIAPWRDQILALGFRTTGAFPLRVRGEVAGALTVYSAEAGAIGEEETTLLDELAADLGYAIEALDDRAERQRAEEALRKSEERFRGLFENALLGLYGTAPDGAILMANPCLCRMLGYDSLEELKERNLEEEGFEPPYLRSEFRRKVEEKDVVIGLESRWKRRDGSFVFVRETATAVRDSSGKVLYYEGTVEDITERKRAEADLARSELYFRSLIEHSLDITAVLSPEGNLRYVSSSVERILGYRPEELGGMNAFGLVHSEDQALVRSKIQRVLETGTGFETVEARFRHRDGSWRVLSVIGRLLPPEIEERGLIVSARDLTDRQQLEAQLLQAQKMEAVGRLAGGVAHDFNNLLTVIQGYGEMLSTSLGGDETRREQVGEILKAAERAATLTHQLLAFSRRQVLEMRVLDLGAAVGETEKMLRRVIGEDVELVVVKPREPVLVKADSGQIEQVLMNLAVNARDAMPGGGRLIVELSEVHLGEELAAMPEPVPAGRWAVLTVGDNGTGMDAETLSHVFEPFFTTKETGKGTGLGLATVYGIVKQSGGCITVASEPGQGTTFRIFLPKAEEEATAKPEAFAIGTGGAETILLVEDEPGVRGLICRLLEGRGYRVLAAASGAEALALVDRHEGPIPLLVTDLVMPGLNGRELAVAVVSRRPGTRVLFISAYPSGVLSRRGLRESGARFLQKPFTEAALARSVRGALDAPAPASGDAKPGT